MINLGILVLHYGHSKLTKECIKSILKSKDLNFKILVIDNFSPEPFISNSKKVEVIRLKENKGFAGGINFGMRILFKKFNNILILNNDTILNSDTISKLQKSYSSGSIQAPIIYNMYTKEIEEYGGSLNTFSMYYKDLESIPIQKTKVEYLTGACLLFDKEVYQKLESFPEEYFMYSEDMDFNIKAKLKGVDLYIEPNSTLFHSKGASSGGLSPFTIYYIHRNRFLLGKKYNHGLNKIIFLVFYTFLIFLKTIKWFFKKPSLAPYFVLGFLDGLKNKKGKSERF